MSFNWLETIVSLDVDQATNALYDDLHFCVLNFVPEAVIVLLYFHCGFLKTSNL